MRVAWGGAGDESAQAGMAQQLERELGAATKDVLERLYPEARGIFQRARA
jgi:hypothetical protein